VYRAADLAPTGSFAFGGVDGWGLAALPGGSGAFLLSDGSAVVRVVVPARRAGPPATDVLAEVGRFTVTDGGRPVPLVNELHVAADGQSLVANVWMSPYIAVIRLGGLAAAAAEALPPPRGAPPPDAARLPPATVPDGVGAVERWLDAGPLLGPAERRGADVVNGLADAADAGGGLWVTGKLWPWGFRVTGGRQVGGGELPAAQAPSFGTSRACARFTATLAGRGREVGGVAGPGKEGGGGMPWAAASWERPWRDGMAGGGHQPGETLGGWRAAPVSVHGK